MKVVNTEEYVSMLRGLVEEGREVSMVVAGGSMFPFLADGRDSICFRTPDRALRAGDIVFYRRPTGQYVLHRICRVRPEGYDIVGDAQTAIERPVRRAQIFALVTRVQRKGAWIAPGDFRWEFFARVWIRGIPLRPVLLRAYRLLSRFRRA